MLLVDSDVGVSPADLVVAWESEPGASHRKEEGPKAFSGKEIAEHGEQRPAAGSEYRPVHLAVQNHELMLGCRISASLS